MTIPIYCNTIVNTSVYPYFMMSYVCNSHSSRLLSSPSYMYGNPKLLQIFWVCLPQQLEYFHLQSWESSHFLGLVLFLTWNRPCLSMFHIYGLPLTWVKYSSIYTTSLNTLYWYLNIQTELKFWYETSDQSEEQLYYKRTIQSMRVSRFLLYDSFKRNSTITVPSQRSNF